MADRTIQIIIDINDKTNGKLGGLKNQLLAMDKAAEKLNQRFKSFANLKYNATVRLIDRVTEPASRINSLLKKIAGGVYNISLRINDAALSGIRKIESALMRIAGKTYNIAVNLKGAAGKKLEGLFGGALMGAGVFAPVAGMMGVGYGVGNAIQSYAGFEQQMSKVQAIRQLDKNSDEMKDLVQQAKDLGMQTAWTRQQVGEAQYYQALAGWSTQNILATTPHLLNLASASGTDLGRASDIVTDTMTAFGLDPSATFYDKNGKGVNVAEHYIDLLAKLQASSNTTVEQAYGALKYSANQFGALSMNLTGQERVQAAMENARDAAVMTGLMANAGIKDSMSGTGMSNTMQRMVSGNRNVFYALGLTNTQVEDFQHNLLPFEQIIKQLNKTFHEGMDVNKLADFMEEIEGVKIHADTRRKLDKLSKDILENGGKMGSADAQQLATMFGGAEHAHKLLALIMGDWDEMEKKLTDVDGTAEQMAKTMLDNLAGSFTKLGSAWDAFQQSFLEGQAGDGLRNFVDALTEVITTANKLFQDGIQFKDIGAIIGDIVNRLKNKFLELDGIGSILAGGALVGALLKITSLARGALGAIRGVKGGGAGGGLGAGQQVGTMHVTAGVVNINGKMPGTPGAPGAPGTPGAPGNKKKWKVGDQTIIDNYYRTREIEATRAAMISNAKSAATGGAAFAAIFGAFDVMSVKASNAERLANATPETRAQILKENRVAEWEAGGGLAGSVVGSAIGAALGSVAGPVGTAIGGVIGGMLGDTIGRIFGKEGAEGENIPTGKKNSWDLNRGTSTDFATTGTDSPERFKEKVTAFSNRAVKIWNGTLEEETKIADIGGQIAARRVEQAKTLMTQYQEEQKALTATKDQTTRWNNLRKNIEGGIGQAIEEQKFLQGATPQPDYFAQQREQFAELSKQNYGYDFKNMLDNLFFSKAAAAELTPEQQAQQAAMERGEIIQPASIQLPEVDTASWLENIQSQMAEGMANLSTSVGEIFNGISETAGAAFSGLSEIFSGISETAGAAFASLSEIAASALEGVTNAFTAAKETVLSVWGEVPGFFGGILSGLGGAAEAAGSAIYSGLTSVIGSIIGAWEGAAAAVSGIISSISAMGSSVSATVSGVIARVRGHAEGGFITSPELAMIGERGAELILPLTDRERSMELLSQASGVLGLSEEISPSGSIGNSSSSGANVEMNVTFNVNGENAQDIVETIKAHMQEIADAAANQLSITLSDAHHNRVLEV